MAVNDKIDKDDYNSIVTVINNVLGTGSGNSGYGQPVQSSNVSVSSRITVNEWNNLANDLRSIGIHQNNTAPTLPTATAGNIVKFNSTTEPYDRYLTVANNFSSSRFNLGSGQFITVNKGTEARTFSWKNQVECTITIDFGTANDARFFFNSGGQIRISSSRTGGTTSGSVTTIAAQNNSWTDLLNAAGNIDFGGNNPGTGTSPFNAQNFYRCTSAFQTYNTETDSSPYGANDWFLQARTPGIATNNNGTAAILEIKSIWDDGHVPLGGATVDGVDGTLSISVTTIEASGNLRPTGSFTVTSPNVSFTSITGS